MRMDFHPDWVFGVGWAGELISVRIMPRAPKVLNLGELLRLARALPMTAEAKVKFRQNSAKSDDF